MRCSNPVDEQLVATKLGPLQLTSGSVLNYLRSFNCIFDDWPVVVFCYPAVSTPFYTFVLIVTLVYIVILISRHTFSNMFRDPDQRRVSMAFGAA
jgi:hypothetical protein